MDIFQLIGIGLTGAVLSVILKAYRPELAICVSLLTGVILFTYALGIFQSLISMIEALVDASGLDKKYLTVILRIIGISYVSEIASEICRDSGQNAIAVKLEMLGKLFILFLSMPIITGFLEVCTNAIGLI